MERREKLEHERGGENGERLAQKRKNTTANDKEHGQ
jgi:hypothetical protein